MLKPGDVVLTKLQFANSSDIKIRPVLILFEEYDNVVVAGITSNLRMKGIPLTKKEGAIKDSVIKLNYIFTISNAMISKFLFKLTSGKRKLIYEELLGKLSKLNDRSVALKTYKLTQNYG